MRYSILFLFLFLLCYHAALHAVGTGYWEKEMVLGNRFSITFDMSRTGPHDSATMQAFLKNELDLSDDHDLRFKFYNESITAHHFSFDQYLSGKRVMNSEIRFHLSKKGKVKLLNYRIFRPYEKALNTLNSALAEVKARDTFHYETVFFADSGYDYWAYRDLVKSAGGRVTEVIFDTAFDPIATYSRQRHFGLATGDSLVLANGKAFKPDPITSATTTYAPPFVNQNNDDNQALNAERFRVSFPINESRDGLYQLESDYIAIRDFSPPHHTPYTTATPVFDHLRGESAFLETNAYYHLMSFRSFLNNLGFENLAHYPLPVDPHALNGADNSYFTLNDSMAGQGEIALGTGGVPDAEDAGVIVHEYGHALSYYANQNTNYSFHRSGLDEGLCDYLACSYVKDISDYQWEKLFKWDGHNEYWDGRYCTTNKTFPDDINNFNFYANGEMIAGILMDLEQNIGRTATMKILMNVLFFLGNNTDFEEFTELYVANAQELYDASTAQSARNAFARIGLLTSLEPLEEAEKKAWEMKLINHSGGQEEFTVESNLFFDGHYRLMDLAGKVITSGTIHISSQHTFNFASLHRGWYLLEFINPTTSERKVFKILR